MSPTIRPKVVVDEESVEQTAYTLDLDLPTSGILSDLYLIVHARRVATTLGSNAWARNLISSVSVNQAGQAFLNAAPPDVFQADYYYKTGKFPIIGTRRWETYGDIEEVIPILFGEKENDFDHTIDLSKLNDPKLSVTYDLEATDNESVCPWNTSVYPSFSVIANLMQGADIPASKGYLSLRQIEKYTPANSQVKAVELKGSRPIRRILFQYDLKGIYLAMRQNVARIKLWGENEAWVPFDMTSERFKNLVKTIFGSGVARGNYERWYSGRTINNIFDERDYLDIHVHNTVTHDNYAYGGSGHGFMLKTVLSAEGTLAETDTQGYFEFAGIAPWAVYPIDMKKMLGMDYLDPKEHAPVYLELTHGSTAGDTPADIRVIVEDLAQL